MGYETRMTRDQQSVLDREHGYDDGGRFALVAVSGYEIREDGPDDFGTVLSIIDTDTGAEVYVAPVVGPSELTAERLRMIDRVEYLNGDAA